MLGSLDEAAELGAEALRRARSEDHPVRTAHAAFQLAMALVWAERLDEARACVEYDLKPAASIAANRWVAWAAHLDAQLAVRAGDLDEAGGRLQLADRLFRAEALMDGVVSARLVDLTLQRRRRDNVQFEAHHTGLIDLADPSARRWLWYSRRSDVVDVAASIELGEYLRVHRREPVLARASYQRAVAAQWPIYQALGRLGLAQCTTDPALRHECAQEALTIATRIGARLIANASLAAAEGDGAQLDEIFFC
jgi:hypothetical protein